MVHLGFNRIVLFPQVDPALGRNLVGGLIQILLHSFLYNECTCILQNRVDTNITYKLLLTIGSHLNPSQPTPQNTFRAP